MMAQENAGATERIDAITLATADVVGSIKFYQALGFAISYGDASSSFVTLESGTCFVNLWEVKPDDLPATWWGRVIFHVDDVDSVYRRAVDANLSPQGAPADAPWGERFFAISDPSGHDLSFAKRIKN